MRREVAIGLGALVAMPVAVSAAYLALAAVTWRRYGHARGSDRGLDRWMPEYEVAERHSIHVHARAETAFVAACGLKLEQSAVVRAIFRARERVLGAKEAKTEPMALWEQAREWGWGLLEVQPGRLAVFGAVTRPWEASPVFRALPPEEFAAFDEPGYVKIGWTLRAEPAEKGSVVSTETRVMTTDAEARSRFRNYWAMVRPGVVVIRRMGLRMVKRAAERGVRRAVPVIAASH